MSIQTITIDPNGFFQPSEGSIFADLKKVLPAPLIVQKVTRAPFSAYYAVTIDNRFSSGVETVKAAFRQALLDLGYNSGQVLEVKGGETATNAGGIGQAGAAIVDTVKTPLIALAVVAVAVVVLVYAPRPRR